MCENSAKLRARSTSMHSGFGRFKKKLKVNVCLCPLAGFNSSV